MRDLITNKYEDPNSIDIKSPEEVYKLLNIAEINRSTAETIQNERSSRSHLLF